MPRQLTAIYSPISSGAYPAGASARSTGTANIQSIAVPKNTRAVWITVKTNNARLTVDGTAPGAGTGPGLVYPAGTAPVLLPFEFPTSTIKFTSDIAGNSDVDFLFTE